MYSQKAAARAMGRQDDGRLDTYCHRLPIYLYCRDHHDIPRAEAKQPEEPVIHFDRLRLVYGMAYNGCRNAGCDWLRRMGRKAVELLSAFSSAPAR